MDSAEKHVQPVYWAGATFEAPRWRNLIGVGMMGSTMGVAYMTIIGCTVLINKYLKEQMKSALSMRLHKKLFRSLIYQAFVPLFTSYYPVATSVMLPVVGITVPYISIILPPAFSTHPLLDPLVLMLTITEYRHAFLALTGLSKLLQPSSSSTDASNIIQPIELRGDLLRKQRQTTTITYSRN